MHCCGKPIHREPCESRQATKATGSFLGLLSFIWGVLVAVFFAIGATIGLFLLVAYDMESLLIIGSFWSRVQCGGISTRIVHNFPHTLVAAETLDRWTFVVSR